MRVFLTGATGFIGFAIARDLAAAGHGVLGLARSDAAAKALAQAGIETQRGDLSDLDSLTAAARACDGVIHTAFIHDWSQSMADRADVDLRAAEAMAGAMAGTGKPLVVASGTLMVAGPRIATEADGPPDPSGPRAATEVAVLAASERGVRGSVVRLPPSVHGAGDKGFMPMLIDIARRTGVAGYVGDGANRWPAVHRLDAARLFRLAMEKAPPGTRLHGVADEGIPMREIAETIGAGLGLPVRGVAQDAAVAHFGFLGMFLAMDNRTSSALTRQMLDWRPEGPGLLEDMRDNGYFA